MCRSYIETLSRMQLGLIPQMHVESNLQTFSVDVEVRGQHGANTAPGRLQIRTIVLCFLCPKKGFFANAELWHEAQRSKGCVSAK